MAKGDRFYRVQQCFYVIMRGMKVLALTIALLCASAVLAAPRVWKDAKVANIGSEQGGNAVIPVNGMLFGVPITKTFYRIETDDTIYILGPAIMKRQLLNVTLYGKTKIAVEGHNAHILDDDGKDKKIPIAQKIARTQAADPAKP
jgi:hypothetical protein